MVQKLPVEHRARARKIIAEKIAAGHYVRVKDNPELQRLLDDVYNERSNAHRRKAQGKR